MVLYVLGLLARYRFTDRAGADGAVDA
jgi:hypothetical protein